jgi:hypothetical protein
MEGGWTETNPWRRGGSAIRILVTALVVVPALMVAMLQYRYGFNLPYWDGWEEYDLFTKVHQHTLTLSDLFAQHNEHRIFFPRLLLIGAYPFEPYTDAIEVGMVWVLACLSSICLWGLSRRTGGSTLENLLLLAGANVLLFNLLAWEDWLWGFQVGFLLPVLGVTAGAWSVSISRGCWSFFWAFFWSVINTFTIASGFITWLVLLPLLLFPGGKFSLRQKGIFVYALGFAACLFFYLHGYAQTGGAGPATKESSLLNALGYFLIYLGAPLADQSGTVIGLIVGGILVSGYLACLAVVFRHRGEPAVLSRVLPWLTLCHFALGCAAITAMGRLGYGLEQALTSRYIVFSSLLPIGLLFAGAYLFPDLVERVKSRNLRDAGRLLLVAVPVLGFGVYLWNAVESIHYWQQSYQDRLQTQAALVFINVPAAAPILEKISYPNVDALKHLEGLRAQFGVPQKTLADADLSSLEEKSAPDPESGSITVFSRAASTITLSGWVYLPKAKRAADLVLVTLPDSSNRDRVVGMAVVTMAKELPWSVVLPQDLDLRGLKIWSFDGLEGHAYQIETVPFLR